MDDTIADALDELERALRVTGARGEEGGRDGCGLPSRRFAAPGFRPAAEARVTGRIDYAPPVVLELRTTQGLPLVA